MAVGPSPERRLDSWKAIAAFFGRDERTVKRWEARRGLPLHRVPGGGSAKVYAYVEELEAWLRHTPEPKRAEPEPAHRDGVTEAPSRRRRPSSLLVMAAAAAVTILALTAVFGLSTPRVPPKHRVDPVAAELYRTGVYYWHTRTPDGLTRAVDYFTQAIVRDPGYADAYAGLADCYNLLREYTVMAPGEAYPRAKAAAERAIALDPSLAGAHASLAFVDFYWSHDVAASRHEFETALRLQPGSAITHHWYATVLMTLGRFPEAVAEIDRAQALDPESSAILADRGLILFYAGRRDEARALLGQLAQSQPGFLSSHTYLAFIDRTEGDDPGYLRELTITAGLLHDDDRLALAQAARRGLAADGGPGMRAALVSAYERLKAAGRASAYELADSYAAAGRNGDALTWLTRSVEAREPDDITIRIDPAFIPLHALPAYQRLVRTVGGG